MVKPVETKSQLLPKISFECSPKCYRPFALIQLDSSSSTPVPSSQMLNFKVGIGHVPGMVEHWGKVTTEQVMKETGKMSVNDFF